MIDQLRGRDREARGSPTGRRLVPDRGEREPNDRELARGKGARARPTVRAFVPVKAAARNVQEFDPAGAARGSPAAAIAQICRGRGTGPAPTVVPATARVGMIRGDSTTGRTG
jgi:hypothetical protein